MIYAISGVFTYDFDWGYTKSDVITSKKATGQGQTIYIRRNIHNSFHDNLMILLNAWVPYINKVNLKRPLHIINTATLSKYWL
jgi:hypothetical protein